MIKTPPEQALLLQAWQIRSANFAPRIEFINPGSTMAVRTTGTDCYLNCSHCGGHYLKGMRPLTSVISDSPANTKSFLVSGGCNNHGTVPHLNRLSDIKALTKLGALNLHTGLVTAEEAAALGAVADVVSFDLLLDQKTINNVYGLQASPGDYIESYRLLRRFTRVVPHLCLGINRGVISSEYEALQFLQQEGTTALTFIVFLPTPGTAFAGCNPPPVEEVGDFMATARIMLPTTRLSLGCMRPGGKYRTELDLLAIKAGINKLVQPTPPARCLAEELGLEIVKGEECCSL